MTPPGLALSTTWGIIVARTSAAGESCRPDCLARRYRYRQVTLSWGWRWLALLTVLAVIGGTATLAIGHYRNGADRARETEFRLTDVQSAANATNIADWKMIARRHGSPAEVAVINRAAGAIRFRLARTARIDSAPAPVVRRVSTLLDRRTAST
jgi:hypothetical protein